MATEITLPRQGWSMEEAVFVEWLKKDGDRVAAGEPLFAVETEKAVQEVESLDAGILRLSPNGPQKGDTVKVGDVLGYLVAKGERLTDAPGGPPAPAARPASPLALQNAEMPTVDSPGGPPAPAARPARPLALEKAGERQAPSVTPRAARRALLEGVDLRAVKGSGAGGRIREADVVAAPKGTFASPAVSPAAAILSPPQISGREETITTLRRTIAERMHRSKTVTAPVTLTTRVDAGALVRLREGMKKTSKGKPVPAYGDMIMRDVAQALLEHPALNARWENDRIRFPNAVNIGFAVDTEAGLVVPVVRDAPNRPLQALADLTRDLAERAKERRLSVEDMSGGTFTITNLGMAGIDAFTPIVNWPECAVLGVGRITEEPVVHGKKVAIGHRLWLSLTFDHRIVDGAPAARFLETLKARIEKAS